MAAILSPGVYTREKAIRSLTLYNLQSSEKGAAISLTNPFAHRSFFQCCRHSAIGHTARIEGGGGHPEKFPRRGRSLGERTSQTRAEGEQGGRRLPNGGEVSKKKKHH